MADFKASILDYLGKYENGIMARVSIVIDDKYFEGIFYYTDTYLVLTVEKELEENIFHCPIEEWENYEPLMQYLINRVVPWSEMINSCDPISMGPTQSQA